MPRKKIPDYILYERVKDAANMLFEKGEDITFSAVRRQAGISPSRLKPLLDKWFEETGHNRVRLGPKLGREPWNKGLTKHECSTLARPGNGKHFLKDGVPWNKDKSGYTINSKGRPLSEEHKEALRGSPRASGEQHWNWQGGKGKRWYRGSDWNSWKRRIRERDKVCKRCGAEKDYWAGKDGIKRSKNLSVHHFDAWNDGGRNSYGNLVLVCLSCHMIIETNKDENEDLKNKVYQEYRY